MCKDIYSMLVALHCSLEVCVCVCVSHAIGLGTYIRTYVPACVVSTLYIQSVMWRQIALLTSSGEVSILCHFPYR